MNDARDVIVVTGGSGFIGGHVILALTGLEGFKERFRIIGSYHARGERIGCDLRNVDGVEWVEIPLEDEGECVSRLEEAVGDGAVEAVVHCAAMANLAVVERERELAQRVNVEGTVALAKWVKARGGRFVFLSTDQVFDGERGWYREEDCISPINSYGRMKVEAEAGVRGMMGEGEGISLRVSLVYGKSFEGKRSASEQIYHAFVNGEESLRLFTDEYRTPTFVGDIARVVSKLLEEGMAGGAWPGLLHIAGPERVSRYEMGIIIAEKFGFDRERVVGILRGDLDLGMKRPGDLSLDISRARETLGYEPVRLNEWFGNNL